MELLARSQSGLSDSFLFTCGGIESVASHSQTVGRRMISVQHGTFVKMCYPLTSGDLLNQPICMLLISNNQKGQYDHFECSLMVWAK